MLARRLLGLFLILRHRGFVISSVGLAPRCSEVAYKKQLLVFRVTAVVDFCNFIGIILIRMRSVHTN